ncbi:hypothetical protein [Croceicoccus bisphenolivorans]|uniref:hypothetical protein n=1 Tax=Croceicoccus bisphenolivorans TaxID=1783232 RepID=UPI000835EA9B|nr:hypothetical protein [Croceicoccus bisphenolivorans]
MGKSFTLKRMACAMLAASSLLLSGCLLTPGKFTSELTLKKGGGFAYTYDGEISMMGLTQLAKMDGKQTFEAECYDDDFEETTCTAEQEAEQRAEWEAEQAKEAAEKQQFVKMMGSLDPSDPESAEKLAETLRKQRGWSKVTHVGEGLFVVSYAISGNLTHGFVFPMVEKMPMVSPFVTALPRADGSVRVEADGFGGEQMSGMGPGLGMMSMMGAAGKKDDDAPAPVLPDGTFTIVTDGRILANNTDEGPEILGGDMQRLSWKVDVSRKSAPMALIALN